MINPFLTGDKIYLSPLTVDDISDKCIQWLNDSEVCRDNAHATFPNNEARARAYVEEIQKSQNNFVFAIRLKENNEHVGNVSLQSINWINKSGELAILIGEKSAWGKGVGYECYKLLLEYAFKTLNLNRVFSGQTSRNKAMIKICEKAGMKKEGVLRDFLFKNGEYLDLEMYSILKKEYV